MDDKNIFGQRIFELRQAAGMTQKQLGEAVGLKEKSVIAITDSGFAKGMFDCIKDMEVLVYDKNQNQ